jgi:serine/threonine-protein kinase HipA
MATRFNHADRGKKNIVSPLAVFIWLEHFNRAGFVRAGTLSMDEIGAAWDAMQIHATFAYDSKYLDFAFSVYPLDPINLPLREDPFVTNHPYLILGAIFDAAPDAWGRKVIRAHNNDMGTYRHAFLRGADGIGAIVLQPADSSPPQSIEDAVIQSRDKHPTIDQINASAIAARKLELNDALDTLDQNMLAGSWTIGGARPKAILRNRTDFGQSVFTEPLQGQSLIAKLPSLNEAIDRAGIEWACLRMARDMGFQVPGHALCDVETGRALVIERFDRYPLPASSSRLQEGRLHYISANSLVSRIPTSKRLDTPSDIARFSANNLIAIAAGISKKPAHAKVDMYARIFLNAALHNTDDHMKNFGFLRARDGAYSVAPVFDVSPQPLTSHYLHLHNLGRQYSAEDVHANAQTLGIGKSAADEVRDNIFNVLERRDWYFDEAQLSKPDIAAVEVLLKSACRSLFELKAGKKVSNTPKNRL